MNSGKKGKDGVSWADLVENCISTILSFTTVKDVCRLATVCSSWRSAADANLLWERMITLHFGQNISQAISSVAFPSKKQLYISLLRDHGTRSFWVDGSTRKIGCMISARDLNIVWGDDSSYWEWVRLDDDSRFEQVARLRYVWWFDVGQRFECSILSPNTHYTVSFIVRMDKNSVGYGYLSSRYGYGHLSPFIFSVVAPDGTRMESARFLDDLEKPVENHGQGFSMTPLSQDENGWIEFVAGEFFLEEQHASERGKEIEFSMKNIDCTFTKSDIWVYCVKIEPKH